MRGIIATQATVLPDGSNLDGESLRARVVVTTGTNSVASDFAKLEQVQLVVTSTHAGAATETLTISFRRSSALAGWALVSFVAGVISSFLAVISVGLIPSRPFSASTTGLGWQGLTVTDRILVVFGIAAVAAIIGYLIAIANSRPQRWQRVAMLTAAVLLLAECGLVVRHLL